MDFLGRLLVQIVGDNSQLDSSIEDSRRRLQRFGRDAARVGRDITTRLTAPITLAAGAAARLAIQAEETNSAFLTSFRGIEDAADSAAQNLQDNFGLSRLESERLLQSTGDLLRGFGASQQQALDFSTQVQELAVDLASFRNVQGGATRASEALTAAALGETDQLRSLGIVIRQADVDQRILEQGQEDLTGQARLLARAQATLEIAYEQSGDAVGDFARTSESTANQLRQLRSDLTDASVEIGQNLLPVVNDVVSLLRDATERFADLSEEQQQLIIIFGALAAAVGPAVTAVGRLSQAIAFLISSPVIGSAIISLGAITFAVQQLTQATRESRGTVEDLAEELGDTARAVDETAQAIAAAEQFDRTFEDIRRSIVGIADASGRTVDEVIQIGLQSSRIGDEYRAQLQILRDQLQEAQEFSDIFTRNTGLSEQQALQARATAAEQAQINQELEEELSIRQRIQSIVDTTVGVNDALRAIDSAIRAGILDEEQALQRKLDIRTEELERLREQGVENELLLQQGEISITEAQRVRDAVNSAIDQQEARIEAYNQRIQQLTQQTTDVEIDAANERVDVFSRSYDTAEDRYDAFSLAFQQANQENLQAVREITQQEREARLETLNESIEDYQGYADNIIGIFSAITAFENAEFANRRQREREALNESLTLQEQNEQARINAVAAERARLIELDIAQAEQILNQQDRITALDELRMQADEAETERQEALAALEVDLNEQRAEVEEELEQERRRLARRQARRQKAASLFNIATNTASGIVSALALFPPNIPLSIFISATGLAQAAIVGSTPLPALAQGGFFSGPALIGESGREFAFPIDGPQGQTAMALMADRIVDSMDRGGGTTNNNQNITMNSMFALGDESSRRRAARLLYPALENEARRRGRRIGLVS